ncbi:MAG: hypothetical protein OXF64_02090 [bacterium]|nr:hypothetical protein [bacterium]
MIERWLPIEALGEESVELWSPGNPLFKAPELLSPPEELPPDTTLGDILDG